MEDEKLNINVRLYHSYKKLINSYIEYIKDNNNDINDTNEKNKINKDNKSIDKNSFNIKNQKIIGIDCILNIIELLNKNISIIKEKNAIKNKFLEEINNEKNSLLKEIKDNGNSDFYLKMANEIKKDNIQENINNINNKVNINIIPSLNNISSDNKNESNLLNKRIQNNSHNLFKTKIIRTKKKKKKFKRISRKIKFIIKTK